MPAGAIERPVPINVLYIHPVSTFGGASRSLLELLQAFPAGSVHPRVIVPRGQVAEILDQKGMPVLTARGIMQFDCTRFGYYRGRRWLILLRETFYFPFTLWAMLCARRMWRDIHVVHVNEVTALFPVVLAKAIFRGPVVVHVRSVQQAEAIPLRRRLLESVLRRYADAVIAIDGTVGRSLPPDIHTEVIHNGFTPPPTLATNHDKPRRYTVGMVGNLLEFKGVSEFLEAAQICITREMDAEFVLVGENTRQLSGWRRYVMKRLGFAHDTTREAQRFINEHGLSERVRLLGFRLDIENVYQELDVLCFPSHLNAVGRPVLEAAFFGVPGIVAVTNPDSDTLVHGTTGLSVPPKDPQALADAIEYFYRHPEERHRMGRAAYHLAIENFNSRKNAGKVLALYQRLLARARVA